MPTLHRFGELFRGQQLDPRLLVDALRKPWLHERHPLGFRTGRGRQSGVLYGVHHLHDRFGLQQDNSIGFRLRLSGGCGRSGLGLPVMLDVETFGIPARLDAGLAKALFGRTPEEQDRRQQEEETLEHESKLQPKARKCHLMSWTCPW